MPNRERDDEELVALLADLERTLTDLRSAIDADVRDQRRRPPTPGEILRFTEEYTIPTVIALLEATIRSLELLRAVLRLAGPMPDRSDAPTASDVDVPDADALRDALGDLREALTRTDLPADSAAGAILADARDLTEEIDDRLAGESGTTERTDGVTIGVREEGERENEGVDVDAELTSIKESVRDDEGGDADDTTDE